jgi:hypothetical protein
MAMNDASPPSRRLRFSLRTILLVVVIIALGVAQFTALLRVREVTADNLRLAKENEKLRVEAGYLEVEDPTKVAVLQLPQLDELTWRWKVYLPNGRWHARYRLREIPIKGGGTSRDSGSTVLDGGSEVLVAASVRRGVNGKWQFVTQFGESSSRNGLGDDHRLVNTDGHSGHHSSSPGLGKVATFEPTKTIELLRLRTDDVVKTAPNSSTTKQAMEPTDGILIWLERAK